jgi:energy-coupling factor transporter transmembrane protein EcfT
MVWWAALLLTFGLVAVGLFAPNPTMLSIVVASAIWAAFDSSKIHLRKYKSGISYNPVVLFICIIGIWIIAFPWYLIVRGKILAGKAVLKDKFR